MRIHACMLCAAAGLFLTTNQQTFAENGCKLPALQHQSHDEATIERLEEAWSAAYSTGDVEFERCLLLPGYTEVKRNGKTGDLTDELNGAAKNKGKTYTSSGQKSDVSMYGDTAVAHGLFTFPGPDGKPMSTRSSDVYVWKDGAWHVLFAQQTPADHD